MSYLPVFYSYSIDIDPHPIIHVYTFITGRYGNIKCKHHYLYNTLRYIEKTNNKNELGQSLDTRDRFVNEIFLEKLVSKKYIIIDGFR